MAAGNAQNAARRSPGAGRSAFTLIEALIVVAIIALLAAIVLPTLTRARQTARLLLCQDRLRQWGVAFHSYAADTGGCFPHIDGLDRGDGPADRCGWVDVLPPRMGLKPWRERGAYERPGDEALFRCPDARLAPDGYGYYPRRDGYFCYAMNSCLELDENCYRPLGGGATLPSFLQIMLVRNPSRVVLLFDQLLDPQRGYGGARRNRSAGQHCGSYPKDFSVRHARNGSPQGGSILYCDNSVRWRGDVWKGAWPDRMNCPPRDDPDWFPYPP